MKLINYFLLAILWCSVIIVSAPAVPIQTTEQTGLNGNQSISVPNGTGYDINITNNHVYAVGSDAFTHRKLLTINASAVALTDYQILKNITYDTDMQADFDDLRFTTSGGTNVSYWLEEKVDSSHANVWMNVSSISTTTGAEIWMYYGNSGLSSASSINNTMVFGDDFDSYDVGTFVANADWNVYQESSTDLYITESGYTKFGYYNGKGSVYAIGAYIPDNDGLNGVKYAGNPIISPGTGWESGHVKDQSALKINGTYKLWYAGYNGTKWAGIGLATSSDGLAFTKSASNPLLSCTETYDTNGIKFPAVYYDIDETDSNKRYKMFYVGINSTNIENICYAYSADGETWVKYASNPVVSVGSSGEWDDKFVSTPANVVKNGTTYHLYYAGLNATTSKWQTGLVTFTDFEGTYTKSASNPVVPRKIQSQSLTAQTSTGSKIVLVSDTSGFHVNEPVFIRDTSTGDELNTIGSIDSSTQITLVTAVVRNYPSSSTIRSWMYGSNAPKTVQKDGSTWKMWSTAYQPYVPSDLLRESTYYATSTDGLTWTVDYNNSPLLPLGASGSWDAASVENPTVLIDVEQSTDLVKSFNIDSYGSGTLARLASVDTFTDFICESKIKYRQQKNSWIDFRGQNYNMVNPNGYFAVKQFDNHKIEQYNSGWTSGTGQTATLAADTYYHAVITANGNNQNFKINNYMGSNIIDRTETYSVFSSGYVGLTVYSSSSVDDTRVNLDWVFVRKYTATEPTWAADGAEQNWSLTNITASATGASNTQEYNTSQTRSFTLTPTGTTNCVNITTTSTDYNITIVTNAAFNPPQNLNNTTGRYWVNWTWDAAQYADVYDVWIDGVDLGADTATLYYNESSTASAVVNISVRSSNTTNSVYSDWVNSSVTMLDSNVWWNSSWDYYKNITINQTMVNDAIGSGHYPMLVSITDTDLITRAQSDADDIRFVSADNTVQLAHQISSYNSTSGKLVAYVNVSDITNVPSIKMYFGNTAATNSENISGTWGANAKAIWLFDEGEGTFAHDSSGNDNNATVSGAAWDDDGLDFNGASDYVVYGGAIVTGYPFTVTTRAMSHDVTTDGCVVSLVKSSAANVYYALQFTDSTFELVARNPTAKTLVSGTVVNDQWYTASVVMTSETDKKLYVDGQLIGTLTDSVSFSTSADKWYAGVLGGSTLLNYHNGHISYVQLYGYSHTADEIATQHNNTQYPTLFLSVGSLQSSSPTDTSFTVSLPAGATAINFTATTSTDKLLTPGGQTSSIPMLNVTNTGNTIQSFRMYLDTTVSNVLTYACLSNALTSPVEINTTTTTVIISNLAADTSDEVWMYCNLTQPSPGTFGKQFTVNSSS